MSISNGAFIIMHVIIIAGIYCELLEAGAFLTSVFTEYRNHSKILADLKQEKHITLLMISPWLSRNLDT